MLHASEKANCGSECTANEKDISKEQIEVGMFEAERAFAVIAEVLRDDLNDNKDGLEERILKDGAPGSLVKN